jgi:hypothetical protein
MFAVVVVLAWILAAVGVALLIGGSIRLADRRAPFTDHLSGLPAELTVDDVLGARTVQPTA